MDNATQSSSGSIYDTEELKGFARSMSELQMLLLTLVHVILVYAFTGGIS